MSAHLDGNWPGVPSPGTNLVVRFFTPNTDTEVHKSAAITDASGNFDVYDAPVGTYDVGIKSAGSVSELLEDKVFTEGDTTVCNFPSWRGGDLNNSDNVTLQDQNIVLANYGQKGGCYGYAGNWLIPPCPSPPPAGGACYGYVIS